MRPLALAYDLHYLFNFQSFFPSVSGAFLTAFSSSQLLRGLYRKGLLPVSCALPLCSDRCRSKASVFPDEAHDESPFLLKRPLAPLSGGALPPPV